jgi:hypothetical protein
MDDLNFTIGTDPEFGILNLEDNCAYPPIGLIKFDKVNVELNKKHPEHWIFSRLTNPKTILHMDGSALELEINPSNNPESFWKNIQSGINLIHKLLTPFEKLQFSPLPTLPWNTDKYTLENVGEEFIWLTRFGCDPDFDAYSDMPKEKQIEEDAEKHPYRYFGGHIHIGLEGKILEKSWTESDILAQICSVYWGNLCVSHSIYDEEEKLRLYRYGKPGRYRPQPHGIEYRSPSNSWTSNYKVVEKIFDSAKLILNTFINDKLTDTVLELTPDTEKAITTFNKKECEKIYNYAMEIS